MKVLSDTNLSWLTSIRSEGRYHRSDGFHVGDLFTEVMMSIPMKASGPVFRCTEEWVVELYRGCEETVCSAMTSQVMSLHEIGMMVG
jgi:hypothetical protein